MVLSEEAEECATFYGKMLSHDYTTKEVFNKNFFKDWRKTMNDKEKEKIRDLSKCDFTEIDAYFKKVYIYSVNQIDAYLKKINWSFLKYL